MIQQISEAEKYMLRSMKDMEGYSIGATDGIIGQVKDFYFDDDAWVIRYLVVETGAWLASRRVLISPIAIGQPNWAEKIFPVSITQEQVKSSPDIDTDKPVSRQHEMGYLGYYGYPYYWGEAGLWGDGLYPDMIQPGLGYGDTTGDYRRAQAENARADAETDSQQHQQDDPNLRSGNAIMGYYVHATDGDIGHVQGLIVDEKTWAIRYLIVNTSNWWLGHQVLIAPKWIHDVSWVDSKVSVDLTRQAVKDAPGYDSTTALNREQEVGIHKHYCRVGYWRGEAKHEASISTKHAGMPSPEVAARRNSL
jgi:sporulation protein YlmC with PRC-barrel domain